MKKITCLISVLLFAAMPLLQAQNNVTATVNNITPVNNTNILYGNIQSEVSISIDNNNPANLVVAANTDDGANSDSHQEGVYISNDGGNTWAGNTQNYNQPGQSYYGQYSDDFPNELPTNLVGGDPSTAIDANGNIYVAKGPSCSQYYSFHIFSYIYIV